MDKKVKKNLSAALAATMAAGVATAAVPAKADQLVSDKAQDTTTKSNLDELYAKAYEATMKVVETAKANGVKAYFTEGEKVSTTEAVVKAVQAGMQDQIKAADEAIKQLPADRLDLIGTLSSILDDYQHPVYERIVAGINALNAAAGNVKQADINNIDLLIEVAPKVIDNNGNDSKASYSSALDKAQAAFTAKVVAAVEKAEKSESKEDVAAAKALVEELATATGKTVVAKAKELNEKVVKVEEIIKEKEAATRVESINAINSTQAEVTFNKEVKADTVIPKNFKVTDKDGNLLFVSKAELSKDKKVVTLSFFNKFADKGVYTVETTNVADATGKVIEKSTAQFGFAAAKVAKVEFVATKIDQNAPIKVKITDELGRNVTSEHELEWTTSDATVVENGVAKAKNGTAVVEVTVKDTTVKAKTVITVASKEETTFVGYAIDATGDLPADTKKFMEAEEIRTYTVNSDTQNDSLALYFNDQYGESMNKVQANKVNSITNLTPNVVILNNDLTITPVSAGTGYVKVKVGKVEQTLAIDVRNKGAVVSFTAEKDAAELVTSGANVEVKLNFVDQYGSKIVPTTGVTAKAADTTIVGVGVDGSKLTLNPIKEGTTTVTVTYKGKDAAGKDIELKQVVNVIVAKEGNLTDYVAEANQINLDVYDNPTTATVDESKATIKVYPLDSNGKKLAATKAGDTKIVVLDKDGKETNNDEKVIKVDDANDTITAVGAGTATIAVKVGTYVVDKFTFTVADTRPNMPQTVVFSNNAIAEAKVGNKVNDELKNILSVKDINGLEILNNTTQEKNTVKSVVVDYLITNKNNINFGADDAIQVTDVTKTSSADIVVRGIKLYSDAGTQNDSTLIKEVKNLSEVIKLNVELQDAAIKLIDTSYTTDSKKMTVAELNKATGLTTAVEANLDAYKAAVEAKNAGDLKEADKIVDLVKTVNDAVKAAKAEVDTELKKVVDKELTKGSNVDADTLKTAYAIDDSKATISVVKVNGETDKYKVTLTHKTQTTVKADKTVTITVAAN